MLPRILLLCLLAFGTAPHAGAADDLRLRVAEPFLELHTGPGRGYPVHQVARRGDTLTVLRRRTDWIRVETAARNPQRGWVHMHDIALTTDLEGSRLPPESMDRSRASDSRWAWSTAGGDIAGATAIGTGLAYNMTPNLSLRLDGTQVLGKFSDGLLLTAGVRHTPFPGWRISPWFEVGGGALQTRPHATIVQAEDRLDQVVSVGAGVNVTLSRRFVLTADYRRHTVLTSRDTNEEIDEWKFGISVFF